jgi:hypothetical protein
MLSAWLFSVPHSVDDGQRTRMGVHVVLTRLLLSSTVVQLIPVGALRHSPLLPVSLQQRQNKEYQKIRRVHTGQDRSKGRNRCLDWYDHILHRDWHLSGMEMSWIVKSTYFTHLQKRYIKDTAILLAPRVMNERRGPEDLDLVSIVLLPLKQTID